MDKLKDIISNISKSINYASRDSFANISIVHELESFVTGQIKEALKIVPSPFIREKLLKLKEGFKGYEALSVSERKKRLESAQLIMSEISSAQPVSGTHTRRSGTKDPVVDSRQSTVDNGQWTVDYFGTPIQYLKGVGPKRAKLLQKLGITTVENMLFYLPWRYEDRSNIKPISTLRPEEMTAISGVVKSAETKLTPKKGFKIFELIVSDDTGSIVCKWFNQPFLSKVFRKGQRVILNGKVKYDYYGYGLTVENPEYEIIKDGDDETLHTGRIVPIYHETQGLTSRQIRGIIKNALDSTCKHIHEILPQDILNKKGFMPLEEAIREVHFPSLIKDVDLLNRARDEAHRRLIFDEFFLLQLGLAMKKQKVSREKGISFKTDGLLTERLLESLSYGLTEAQERVISEIKKDMASPYPMNRLLQGDVGCGKTIVALVAMFVAVENGYQASLMAPTEILSEQHYLNIRGFIDDLGIDVCLITSGMKRADRGEKLRGIASGAISIVLGTHALIQDEVRFKALGLAVIDEQHKFGVLQRATLMKKGYNPDVLVMTATPIPRTLALSVYGDLDLSIIDELPPGRLPVTTRLFYEGRRWEAYQLINSELKKGRQAYVVYPLVEESEKVDLKAVTEMTDHLQREVFPQYKVGMLHGRMKGEEKERIMREFKKREIDILVSTTVIEVGVDVSNATVMLVEHAERFGLAQLHQLRGRVGRGADRSYCLLMAVPPISEEASRRLNVMVNSSDGFVIAEEDLSIRGPGEFFGTRQSGLPEIKIANIIRDARIMEEARSEAFSLIGKDPTMSLPQHRFLKETLKRKWQERLELGTVS